jgi:signal transduction histidine kinase/DNA-binding NarL/FixJ family response regulator
MTQRVLLVEDNAGDVELVRKRLASMRPESFELAHAESLEAGIAAQRGRASAVVLLDLNLPDSGGVDTVSAFRAAACHVPLVVLTGTSDIETAVEALRRGADDYVAKEGLSTDLLARTIRYAIERRRMIASLERERATVMMLQDVGATIASELDRDRLVQKITDVATHLVGATLGAFFYDVTTSDGTVQRGFAVSGAHGGAFAGLGLPSATPLLGPTYRGEGPVRIDDVRLDPRYGRAAPHHGLPPGHPPVTSYLAVPVRLRDGKVLGALLFGHPQRARFDAEHERLAVGIAGWAAVAMDNARLYDEARSASRARENLLQVVSHDLRNHVNTMRLGLQVLRKGVAPESMRRFEAVERASTTMRRLLEDLVDIAAVEKGVLSVVPVPVDVRELLDEARVIHAPTIESKGIEVEWSVPDAGVGVQADRERVLQVIGNLVGNAMKFTPTGGRIAVVATVRARDVAIAVSDTGPGIPVADRARVFDRFFRGARPSGHGAGLGLAIARALVQAHGGQIEVDGAPGQGATFRFTLPRVET